MRHFTSISTEFAGTNEKLNVDDLEYYSAKFVTFITITICMLAFNRCNNSDKQQNAILPSD